MGTFDILIVGCGLSGMVIARELAEDGKRVHVIEKRNHIGGNIFDYYDENGILVQKYGPHVFFTDDESIEEYVNKFCSTYPFYPECRTVIDGMYIPMPFNFASIDILYPHDKAVELKRVLEEEFGKEAIVSVVDVIDSKNPIIHDYGMFMYEREYKKYTSKQWARDIDTIDPSVFLRVPVYISYKKAYLRQKYQYLPERGFTEFAKRMLDHPNISVELNVDALNYLEMNGTQIVFKGDFVGQVIYSGPIDALFHYKYGKLPYRSLEFTWKVIARDRTIETPLCAFPEADKYIRITDYTQFPPQDLGNQAIVAIEYPLEYNPDEICGNEPYYPVLTDESKKLFEMYKAEAKLIKNLICCGRLADFKYYNMDATIMRAREVAHLISKY